MSKICILAAGLGSRLKTVSSFHKALLPIGNSATISHIINNTPSDSEFIIAVGHQKEFIKEYCFASHYDKKITFVEVDNFNGPGSGPGYSLNCCKAHLQCPFYLFCVDCIVREPLPSLNESWIGVSEIEDSSVWSTALIEGSDVLEFKNKSKDGYKHAFIGVAGISDYNAFWSGLTQGKDTEFEMVSAFYNPSIYKNGLKAHHFTWYDTGTVENYNNSTKSLSSEVKLGMSKTINELTYKENRRCIKLFENKEVCQGRIHRASLLKNKIPNMVYKGNYVYAYEWIDGKTLYEINDLNVFKKFLTWCKENLWIEIKPDVNFSDLCKEFYYDKTMMRYQKYLDQNNIDKTMTINGIEHKDTIKHLLSNIDWEILKQGIPVIFHGDLQFENIIYTNNKDFSLIDWRDSFSGKPYGDLYYDLAKLYAGLMICFNSVKLEKFTYSASSEAINYKIESTSELGEMRAYYENWIIENGYDFNKVKTLTGLIYLNMSPLHTQPFSDILFNHAKCVLSSVKK